MAKHAKPTVTSTLSANGARGAVALAVASAGFLATAPTAVAGSADDPGHDRPGDGIDYRWSGDTIDVHESQGVVNVSDNTVRVPVQACNNYVPVNVLGVQVPIQEVAVGVAVGADGQTEVAVADSCGQAIQDEQR